MRKHGLLLLVVATVACGTLSALDFGGTIDNTSGYFTSSSPNYNQANKLALWFNTQLGPHVLFDAQASGYYQNQTTYGGTSFGLYADLDRLDLRGQIAEEGANPNLLSFDFGRFAANDPTGLIYDQGLDGLRIGLANPYFSVTTTLGYTGLTIKPSSSIIMSLADLTGITTQAQYFGSPRVIGMLSIDMPGLLLRQDLTFAAMAEVDVRPFMANNNLLSPGTTVRSPTEGGSLDSQYFIAKVSGPIVGSLFWNGAFAVQTGQMLSYIVADGQYEYKPILAYLATGGFHLYAPQLLKLAVGLDATYASGDRDFATFYEGNTAGNATAFIPITQKTVAAVFSPQIDNILTGSLSVSFKPLSGLKNPNLSNLQFEVKGIPFLRPTTGPISATSFLTAINGGNTQYYLGTEVDGSIKYRPFSDLGLSITGGAFIANPAALASSAGALQWGGKVEASLSL